jgi:hypothetical protein
MRMSDHSKLLSKLVIGDIFHASSQNLSSLICLVMSVSQTNLKARTVTTQIELEFDRCTGVACWGDEAVPCSIDSVVPLPVDIHNIVVGIDRKFRLEVKESRLKLNDAEIQALIFIDSYYAANLL